MFKPTYPTKLNPNKILIKTIKRPPQLPENCDNDTWQSLSDALNRIFKRETINFSLEELCLKVSEICRINLAESLYLRLQGEVGPLISDMFLIFEESYPESPIRAVYEHWKYFEQQSNMIKNIFIYLNQMYCVVKPRVLPIQDMLYSYYCERLLTCCNAKLFEDVIIQFIQEIERDRNGEAVDYDMMSKLVNLFSSLHFYYDKIVPIIQRSTNEYYDLYSNKLISKISYIDYINVIDTSIAKETVISEKYLKLPDFNKKIIIQNMLTNQLDYILSQLTDYIRNNEIKNMAKLFHLILLAGKENEFSLEFMKHATNYGVLLCQDTQDIIKKLIDFKDLIDNFLEHSFDHSPSLQNACNKVYSDVFNHKCDNVAILLARDCDLTIRRCTLLDERNISEYFNKLISIFRCLEGKDTFELQYRNDLAKRLLYDKFILLQLENKMIEYMKSECGPMYTNKIEDIKSDFDEALELNKQYASSKEYHLRKTHSSKFYVISSKSWPDYQIDKDMILPNVIIHELNTFESFYKFIVKNKHIKWIFSMSHCVITCTYPKCVFDLELSLYQTLVLLLFNNSTQISFSQIHQNTNIDVNELQNIILSLTSTKMPLLLNIDDDLSLNPNFTTNQTLLILTNLETKENDFEKKAFNNSIAKNRQYQIDALIVRIMKVRRTLTSNLLITEVRKNLNFPVTNDDIDKRIENLIGREYIEKDPKNPQLFNYVTS